MQITLIRHGMTAGNQRHAYIGTTDEPLSTQGESAMRVLMEKNRYPAVQAVAVSPLLRCRQTAAILYPLITPMVCDGLRECAFGAFENATYEDLKEDPAYRAWIATGGTEPPPQGEGRREFGDRCAAAFLTATASLEAAGVEAAAFVVHGGVIMALMERFALPHRPFYDWQVQNGNGFTAHWTGAVEKLTKPLILWEEGAMVL